MKDLVAMGWKTKNGFKPGYLLKLEAGMLKMLPGLLQCYGECWDCIVKADPNTINMCFKAWTLYDDWNEIFRMDHANGRAAEDVADVANDIQSDNDLDVEDHPDDPIDPAPVETPVEMDVASKAPVVDNSTVAKVTGKKRATIYSSNADRLCDVLGQFCKSSDNRFNNLVQVIGYESGLGGTRKELLKVLADIPELIEDERIEAAHIYVCQER
ncbi:hypothetical protein ACS0TY_014300 [Phlomoides rotata]